MWRSRSPLHTACGQVHPALDTWGPTSVKSFVYDCTVLVERRQQCRSSTAGGWSGFGPLPVFVSFADTPAWWTHNVGMPKIDSLDKAGELLIQAAQNLKNASEGYGPEHGRRMTSPEAVYATVQDIAGHLTQAALALGKVGIQLRNAAAELENLEDS
jgi:hypothetical protein